MNKIALTCNIRPPEINEVYIEWDEQTTIEAIEKSIQNLGYKTFIFDVSHSEWENKLLNFAPSLVLNLAEGVKGSERESVVPRFLEKHNIPYTGSSSKTLDLCLDKGKFKNFLLNKNIPTPSFWIVDDPTLLPQEIIFPVIVKPLWEGSSKGITNDSLVRSHEELKEQIKRIIEKYDQPAIVETFLPGKEYTVPLIGNDLQLQVLPIVEISFSTLPQKASPIYGFEAKWIWDTREKPLDIFQCPAPISPIKEKEIIDLAKKTFQAANLKDWARIDFRECSQGKVHVLEVNPLPGIIPDEEANSCFPKSARTMGWTYDMIIKNLLNTAKARYGLP